MPKRAAKHRNEGAWPVPKKGKARALAKRPAMATKKRGPKSQPVLYNRSNNVQKKFRKDRMRFGVSIQSLLAYQPGGLIRQLTQDKMLPSWTGKTCPHCAAGKLGPLHYFKEKRVWVHRCSKRGCQKRIQPHDFHPIFFGGRGTSLTSLGHQAAVLCCALAGVPVTAVPTILDMDDKAVYRVYQNLEITRARHVLMKQKDIKYGSLQKWADVEADEVDIGKEICEDNDKAKWEQWGGIVERGRPETLALFRLNPIKTKKRAPGPGPLRRRDWKPIAEKMLRDRQIILHTDGARSYKLALPGVFHDHVVHKKKRVKVRGKTMWIKPHYTKVCSHKLPDGKVLKVKAGTQIVDRFWGHLRAHLKYIPRKVGSAMLARKVRAAQWTYWHKDQNLWAATGTMLEELCT